MSKLTFSFKSEVVPVTLIVLSFAAAFYLYPILPDRIPTHWNFSGQIDQYSNKTFGIFLSPVLNIVLYLFFLALPTIDPKRERYNEMQNVYHVVKNLIVIFITSIFAVTMMASLGYDVKINIIMPIAIGLLFMIMGNYMGKLKPNWFIGIRTPWTLSSDEIWNRTHRLGGKLFVAAGLLLIISSAFQASGQIMLTLFISAVIIAGFLPLIYSFILFRKQK